MVDRTISEGEEGAAGVPRTLTMGALGVLLMGITLGWPLLAVWLHWQRAPLLFFGTGLGGVLVAVSMVEHFMPRRSTTRRVFVIVAGVLGFAGGIFLFTLVQRAALQESYKVEWQDANTTHAP